MAQISRIRSFLTGQLFGTVLNSGVLFFFLPVMFYFSPVLTAIILGACAVIAAWLIIMLPAYPAPFIGSRKCRSRPRRISFTKHLWNPHRQIARARCTSEASVGCAYRTSLQGAFREGGLGNLIESVVRPMERLMVSGTFALRIISRSRRMIPSISEHCSLF